MSCTTPADCTNACPPGSVGCACVSNPEGQNMCVPSCSKDADCPTGGPQPLTCDETQGVCVPDGAP